MERSPYFASKPRACMSQEHDITMALLKLAMRSCLLSGGSLSYDARVYVYALEDCIQIARPTEPADPIEVAKDRVEDAVNIYVDTLAYEVSFDPENFVLTQSDAAGGVSWGHLRRNRAIRALCDPRTFPFSGLVNAPEPAAASELLDGEGA